MLFCEHAFVTSQGSAGTCFRPPIQARNVFLAETAAIEPVFLSLEDVLQLVVLYAEAEDDKFEKAGWGGGWARCQLETSIHAPSRRLFGGSWVSQSRGPGAGWVCWGRLRRSRGR